MTTSRGPRIAPEVAAQRAALLEELGLPVSGPAYRKPVKIAAWIVLGLLTVQLISVATRLPAENLNQALTLTVLFCYVGMAALTVAMQRSITTIDARGLRQTWIMRREVAWEDVNFVKFIPYPLGKRLMIFNRGGRFVTLQAGTREVEVAFARIALVYKRSI